MMAIHNHEFYLYRRRKMRTLKKCAAIVLAAAMVITAAPSNSVEAAKSLN